MVPVYLRTNYLLNAQRRDVMLFSTPNLNRLVISSHKTQNLIVHSLLDLKSYVKIIFSNMKNYFFLINLIFFNKLYIFNFS